MASYIKALGTFGGKAKGKNNTCYQISPSTLIDAGNILQGLGEDAQYIDHIFLTHSHLDHIVDIPFLIDAFFEKRESPLVIYGLKETIEHLNTHIFNWDIWPDFCEIALLNQKYKAVEFKTLELNQEIFIENFSIKALKTNHTTSSCGYVITQNNRAILFTSDTYRCQNIWDEINSNKCIHTLITDISFPSRLATLAKDSKHMTPSILQKELKNLQRDDINLYINHLKPNYVDEIVQEAQELGILLKEGEVLYDNKEIPW